MRVPLVRSSMRVTMSMRTTVHTRASIVMRVRMAVRIVVHLQLLYSRFLQFSGISPAPPGDPYYAV
jgi:hypothetical protein